MKYATSSSRRKPGSRAERESLIPLDTGFRRYKGLGLLCVLIFVGAMLAPHAMANPFMSGKPSEASSFAMNFFATPFLQEILNIQRQIHELLTNQIEALKTGHSLAALWQLLLVSFAYGIFHVLAPGHGKVIVTSYFVGNEARWPEGVWAGFIMSAGHTLTAIAVVGVLYLAFGLTQFGVLAQARYVELLGYGLIMAIGLWLLYKAITNKNSCSACGHGHHHHDHAHDHHHHHEIKNSGTGLFAAASLVPCSGSMIILLFTMVNGVLWAGVLAVIAIALGMWLTVTAFGLAAIFFRRTLLEGKESKARNVILKTVRIIAALLVTATGGLLFIGTLYTLT